MIALLDSRSRGVQGRASAPTLSTQESHSTANRYKVLVERPGVKTVFAFDRHFRRFGNVAIVP
jgi:hypothetical protein